jgi:hypothetical protein
MTAPIDYSAVLADLEARRTDLKTKLGQTEAAIAVVRAMLGVAPEEVDVEGAGNGETATVVTSVPTLRGQNTTIQSDTFFRLSTPSAVRKYLSMMKRPQKPRAIADALQQGGQVHAADSQTAYMNVHTALKRGRDKDFVQTRNGEWGLAEWYGNKTKADAD